MQHTSAWGSGRLLAALLTATLLACSGGSSQSATGAAAVVAAPGGPLLAETAPAKPAPMRPLTPTQYGKTLYELGLDDNNLPTMDKLTPEQLRKVMGLFTKSLGVDCKFCHKGGDFRAPTEHKQLAKRMWNEWVHGMKLSAGGAQTPVFCDSCHQGRAEFLDKSNQDELARWMKAELVDRLHPSAGGAMSCETCHGTPFDGDFLQKWEKL